MMRSTAILLSALLLMSSCGPFRQTKAPLPPPTPMPARIPDQVSNTDPAPPPKNLPPRAGPPVEGSRRRLTLSDQRDEIAAVEQVGRHFGAAGRKSGGGEIQ